MPITWRTGNWAKTNPATIASPSWSLAAAPRNAAETNAAATPASVATAVTVTPLTWEDRRSDTCSVAMRDVEGPELKAFLLRTGNSARPTRSNETPRLPLGYPDSARRSQYFYARRVFRFVTMATQSE